MQSRAFSVLELIVTLVAFVAVPVVVAVSALPTSAPVNVLPAKFNVDKVDVAAL